MALVKNCRHKWTTQKFRILVLVLVPVAIILLCVLKYDFFDALALCSIYLVTLRAKRVFYGVYLFHLNLFISAAVLLVWVVRSCWRRGWPEDRLFRLSSAESIENVRDFCSEDKAKQCQRMKKIHKKKKKWSKTKKEMEEMHDKNKRKLQCHELRGDTWLAWQSGWNPSSLHWRYSECNKRQKTANSKARLYAKGCVLLFSRKKVCEKLILKILKLFWTA